MATKRRSLSARALRGAGLLLAFGLVMTVLPVVYLGQRPPPTTSFMLQRSAEARAAGRRDFELRHAWADLDDVSPAFPLAVLSAEDQKFTDHDGFDTHAIRHAIADRIRGQALRGGSTLTQQLAKNLFLWPGKSLLRKGLEAYFTLLIEGLWDKRRILEVYVNVAELGDGIFGVQSASRAYFGIDARALTPAQAALLAAVLPNPRVYSVRHPSARVRGKQKWILQQMHYHRSVGTLAELSPRLPRSP